MIHRLLSYPPFVFVLGITLGKVAAVAGDYDWGDVALFSPFLFAIALLMYARERR